MTYLPPNIGNHLFSDKANSSQRAIYTIVTNKKAKSKKTSIIAIIALIKTERAIELVTKINSKKKTASYRDQS